MTWNLALLIRAMGPRLRGDDVSLCEFPFSYSLVREDAVRTARNYLRGGVSTLGSALGSVFG